MDDFELYVKIFIFAIIGWKLGRLESAVHDILNNSGGLNDQQKTTEHR